MEDPVQKFLFLHKIVWSFQFQCRCFLETSIASLFILFESNFFWVFKHQCPVGNLEFFCVFIKICMYYVSICMAHESTTHKVLPFWFIRLMLSFYIYLNKKEAYKHFMTLFLSSTFSSKFFISTFSWMIIQCFHKISNKKWLNRKYYSSCIEVVEMNLMPEIDVFLHHWMNFKYGKLKQKVNQKGKGKERRLLFIKRQHLHYRFCKHKLFFYRHNQMQCLEN